MSPCSSSDKKSLIVFFHAHHITSTKCHMLVIYLLGVKGVKCYKKQQSIKCLCILICPHSLFLHRGPSQPSSDSEFLHLGKGQVGTAIALLPLSSAGGLHGITYGLPGLLWFVILS